MGVGQVIHFYAKEEEYITIIYLSPRNVSLDGRIISQLQVTGGGSSAKS